MSAGQVHVPLEPVAAGRRQKDRVQVRDLLCYWAVVELGIPVVDMARKFDITLAAISYAVQRGEKTAKKQGYNLKSRVT